MASKRTYGTTEYGLDETEYTLFRRYNDAISAYEIAKREFDEIVLECERALRERGATTARNTMSNHWRVTITDNDGNEIGYNAISIVHAFNWLRKHG